MLQGKFRSIYEVNIKEELARRLEINKNQIHFINDAAAFLEGKYLEAVYKDTEEFLVLHLVQGWELPFITEL